MHIISVRTAAILMMVCFSVVLIFHLLVLGGLVPPIVWGGNVSDEKNLWIMETIALFVNFLMLAFVAGFTGLFSIPLHRNFYKVGFWIMFGFFLLNSLGNLASDSAWETKIFLPITVLLTFCSLKIALSLSRLKAI